MPKRENDLHRVHPRRRRGHAIELTGVRATTAPRAARPLEYRSSSFAGTPTPAIDLDSIDLKLLSVFEAVMIESSFSRAAKRLGLTQSAVSQAIARLRPIIQDDLFERTGRGVRPTPRACELEDPIRRALGLLRQSLNATTDFDPETIDRTFFIAMRPDVADAFSVKLYRALPAASKVRLYVVPAQSIDPGRDLRYGEPEIAVFGETVEAHGHRNELLFNESTVMLARRGHPGIETPVSWETYARLGHVALSRSGPSEPSPIDLEFKRRGTPRQVPFSMPTAASVLKIVEHSDLVCTLGRNLAQYFVTQHDLEIHELPVGQLTQSLYMAWHERFDNDRGHLWLRRMLRTLLTP